MSKAKGLEPPPAARTTRCAIYTRVSSDDGLSQTFTSIDAQRASGEAFIKAHEHEGWRCLPERFEDGGYSGGNLERPAIQRLLEKVEAGEIDCIIVYKLDRFTRSIRDFGRLAEILERKKVALVSVTQSIDTATSMGRLMLHILLSFAAFERELASERTRDKIALMRQRGQWSGGRPPLGYDINASKLIINEDEACVVRSLYAKYLEVRSLSAVLEWAKENGVCNKAWTSKGDRSMGGCGFVKSTLAQLLSSVVYIGRVPHKDKSFPGQHPGIVDPVIYKRVQELLAENGRCGSSTVRNKHGGLLKGILKCGCCGGPMVHSSTRKRDGTIYRYYLCLTRQAYGAKRCAGGTVPAGQIEDFVLEKVRAGYADPALVTLVLDTARSRAEERIRDLEARCAALTAEHADAENTVGGRAGNARTSTVRSCTEIAAELADAREQLDRERAGLVDRATVESGLRQFDAIWSTLSPSEKSRVLALSVAEVTFDGANGEITIELNDGQNAITEAAA